MKTLSRPKVIIRSRCARCTYPGLYGLVVTHDWLCQIFRRKRRAVHLHVSTKGQHGVPAIELNHETKRRRGC